MTRALLALCAALALAEAAPAKPTVILVSMDGVRHDYLARGELPTFARIARDGARAESLTPVFPSITFPAHTTLSTGAHPDVHGIVNNTFTPPGGETLAYGTTGVALEAEPLWAAAERQGVKAATFFWPISETAWRGVAPSYSRAPFDSELPESAKVEQILAWLDLPEAQRPGLVMTWWHGADGAGHENGPDAEATRAALRDQDAELGRLIAGIDARKRWHEVTLLVVSDHGMLAPEDVLDANDLLAEAGVAGRAINASALALVTLSEPREADAAAKQLAAADPRVRAYPRAQLPRALRFAHPNAGDVVLLVDPPLAFMDSYTRLDWWRRISSLWGGEVGVHGYDAEKSPAMRAIFCALGRGIAPGAKLARVRALDVAATVAHLLGIAPPAQNEGRVIAGIGGP
ncbi:MAG: alkaline phosphatase family protein [Deltaproteobacteria bacterium]|nr:alkaline phosphatase family protein [Deltaproteobacteria bacterium]